jgi:hypothetical protein
VESLSLGHTDLEVAHPVGRSVGLGLRRDRDLTVVEK